MKHLTKEEEIALFRKFKNGDEEAAYLLIKSFMPFADAQSVRVSNNGYNIDDIKQEGRIGLMTAMKKFNTHRGVRFVTYAAWWIKAYVIRYMHTQKSVVKHWDNKAEQDFSLDMCVDLHEDSWLDSLESDGPTPESMVATKETQDNIKQTVKKLSKNFGPIGMDIVNNRFMCDNNTRLEDIAYRHGTSRESVRLVELKVKDKLKSHLLEFKEAFA